jgi:hypothetical protein
VRSRLSQSNHRGAISAKPKCDRLSYRQGDAIGLGRIQLNRDAISAKSKCDQRKEKLVKVSQLSEDEIVRIYQILLRRITLYKEDLITADNRAAAYALCRMHFSIEFPFPNKKERRRIWGAIGKSWFSLRRSHPLTKNTRSLFV